MEPADRADAMAADDPGGDAPGGAVDQAPDGMTVARAPDGEDAGLDAPLLERLATIYRRLRTYCRLRADGLEHVPREGPAILVANHTGWLGLDYALTALSVHDASGRYVRGMVHDAWFRTRATSDFARRVGLFRISKEAMRGQLAADRLVMVFPEGEKGAFRPGSDYTLETFARGFVRVAMETGASIVPVCILGGEEANPVRLRLDSYEALLSLPLPVPRNLLPRPVKWRIRFLAPVAMDAYAPSDAADREAVHRLCDDVRDRIQRSLRAMIVERGHPYL